MSTRFDLTEDDFRLMPGTVHIWHMPALSPAELLDQYQAVLSPRERQKFTRLKHRRHQQRQIEAQAKMRIILGRYLLRKPNELTFQRMAYGKPYLTDQNICFNLTHSGDQGLLAVSQDIELGIDLECWKDKRQLDRLVHRYFAVDEVEAWQTIPEAAREAAFFDHWTRKEAFMKATGRGLGLGLGKCSFSWNAPSKLLACPDEFQPADQWRVYDIDVGPRASASLVVQTKSCRILQGQWSDLWLQHA